MACYIIKKTTDLLYTALCTCPSLTDSYLKSRMNDAVDAILFVGAVVGLY